MNRLAAFGVVLQRLFLLLSIFIVLTAATSAQSGRRIKNPPPPPPPPEPVQEALTSEERNAGVYPEGSTTLPKSLLTRELESIDEGSFRLADFSDKVIVVNLWATWCGPCRREVPDYEKVRKEYAGRGVEFIGLSTEDPITARNRVQKFARDFNFGFRLGWADRETARALMNGRNGIPQTLVIATNGRLISHWSGYSARQSADRLRAAIEGALSATSSSAKSQ
jgi:thiol-disulfide isomerase/thioredoxin